MMFGWREVVSSLVMAFGLDCAESLISFGCLRGGGGSIGLEFAPFSPFSLSSPFESGIFEVGEGNVVVVPVTGAGTDIVLSFAFRLGNWRWEVTSRTSFLRALILKPHCFYKLSIISDILE